MVGFHFTSTYGQNRLVLPQRTSDRLTGVTVCLLSDKLRTSPSYSSIYMHVCVCTPLHIKPEEAWQIPLFKLYLFFLTYSWTFSHNLYVDWGTDNVLSTQTRLPQIMNSSTRLYSQTITITNKTWCMLLETLGPFGTNLWFEAPKTNYTWLDYHYSHYVPAAQCSLDN